jgi:phage-related minor tail protein
MADQDTAREGAIAQLTQIQQHLDSIAQLSGLPALKNQAAAARTGITELQAQTDQLAKTMRGEFTDDVSNAFTDFVTGAKSAGDAFAELLGDIETQLLNAAIKSEIQNLFGGSSGAGGIFESLAAAFTGGGYLSAADSEALGSSASAAVDLASLPGLATGGPVTAGKPYLVGENGPEPFIPSTNGTILPTGSVGGQQIVQHFIIQAPNGSVSKATQVQLGAAAARGLAVANARNN